MNTSSSTRRPTYRPRPCADGRSQRSGRPPVVVPSAGGKATDELTGPAREMPTRRPLCELDAVLSVGEQISCASAAMAVHELGLRAVSSTGGQAGIRTDDRHGHARLREVRPEIDELGAAA